MLLETLAAPVAATGMFTLAWTMIAVPAVMAGLLLLGGKLTDRWGHLAGTAAVLWSFAIAACLFGEQLIRPASERAVSAHLYTWFGVGEWTFEVGLLVDQLSILFALLISAWVLKERIGRARLCAAALIVAGVVVLRLG